MRRILIIALSTLLIAGGILVAHWTLQTTPIVRDHAVTALNTRFDSQVTIDRLHAALFPTPSVTGGGITIRHDGRTDIPPLITVGEFNASASVWGLLSKRLHLAQVKVEHLNVAIPPGGLKNSVRSSVAPTRRRGRVPNLIIDEIVTRNARLEIASRKPGRLPRVFDIEELIVTGAGRPEGADFHATVMNPIPRGRIDTTGRLGPWVAAEPAQTPLRGNYTFTNADLNVIKGIGGILSSTGTYDGVLERIAVRGETSTPDFMIDVAGQKVPLTTTFQAVVDGTNGDTWLERVEAHLEQSTIIAKGAVVRTKDVKGRRVTLDITVERARLEDLMRLAVKAAKPPLTGRVDVVTTFVLPQGEASVVDRLQLNGRFNLAQARFADLDVQKRITMLSQRSRGNEAATGDGESVVSNLRGRFVLRNATLSFSDLSFRIPGAVVQLTGTYNLRSEQIDFVGDLLLDASLSDMTSGVKSLLARLAQPFFRRPGGGSRIPIKIHGARSEPAFGVDMKRVFKRES